MQSIIVEWEPRARFSRYQRGRILQHSAGVGVSVSRVYLHFRSNLVKVYTAAGNWPLADQTITINGETVLLTRVGRHGHLHHGVL